MGRPAGGRAAAREEEGSGASPQCSLPSAAGGGGGADLRIAWEDIESGGPALGASLVTLLSPLLFPAFPVLQQVQAGEGKWGKRSKCLYFRSSYFLISSSIMSMALGLDLSGLEEAKTDWIP